MIGGDCAPVRVLHAKSANCLAGEFVAHFYAVERCYGIAGSREKRYGGGICVHGICAAVQVLGGEFAEHVCGVQLAEPQIWFGGSVRRWQCASSTLRSLEKQYA